MTEFEPTKYQVEYFKQMIHAAHKEETELGFGGPTSAMDDLLAVLKHGNGIYILEEIIND